ncbi:hypothetical protein ADEAN_000878300 [Angomonas deanei]|uniref:Uncharacterized protein n=1 Tax=Angomonas deanei TaxID=59799 RepID=A0A7G2CSR3_9TRYP|nr:hypothetical protein ADEAN_000878300 [Angomonas deanei]
MKQILLLQQFACLCLQLGKIVSAEETIVKIQDCAAWYSDSGPSFRDYALNVEQMCEGFKYVFKGMFKEASEVFRALATQTSRTGDKEIVQAFDHMRTCNQVSYISCFTYSERESGKDPLTIMPSILSTMENFLKENPNNLLRSSGFLNQAARLYALSSGVKKETFAGLADLMEKHVLEKSSIPDLASLI